MFIDALLICGVSVATTVITEGIILTQNQLLVVIVIHVFVGATWYFIYRKPAYQKLKAQIDKTYDEIEKLKRDGKDYKKCQKLEKDMKKDNTILAGMKMYSMVFLSIIMYIVYQVLRSTYTGVVVARLPFVPFQLLTRMTHSGLEATDYTECNMGGIYALCTIAIRSNVLKLISNNNPRGTTSFLDNFKEPEKEE